MAKNPNKKAPSPQQKPVSRAMDKGPACLGSTRTCVGCRESCEREKLFRVGLGTDGQVCLAVGANGRGCWVHPKRTCIENAAKRRSFERGLKLTPGPTPVNSSALISQMREFLVRRIATLISIGLREKSLVCESDFVVNIAALSVPLVVVASDATEVASSAKVKQQDGLRVEPQAVRLWGSRADLGHFLGRSEENALLVLSAQMAAKLVSSIDCFVGLEG